MVFVTLKTGWRVLSNRDPIRHEHEDLSRYSDEELLVLASILGAR